MTTSRRYFLSSLMGGVALGAMWRPARAAAGQIPLTMQIRPVVVPSAVARPGLASPRPFVQTLHGVEISDPWRWMEAPNDPEVAAWTEGQTAYAARVLAEPSGQDRLLAALAEEFDSVPTLEDIIPIPRGVVFDRWLPSGQTFHLARPGQAEVVLFDRTLLRDAGRSDRIRAVTPSWDGRYLAVTATGDGDGAVQASVFEIATGRLLADLIPDVLTTTSGARYRVAWLPDSSGFIYPRLAEGALSGPAVDRLGRGRQYLHRLGTPQADDVPVFGHAVDGQIDLDPDDLPAAIVTAPGSDWIVATASRVRQNMSELWAARLNDVAAGRAQWRRLAADGFRQPRLRGDRVHALTDLGADRGRIVSLDLSAPDSAWQTEIAERPGLLRSFVIASDGLYFTEYREGAVTLARSTGAGIEQIDVPRTGDLQFAPQDPTRDTPWIKAQSWTDPVGWFQVPPDQTTAIASEIDPGGRRVDRSVFEIRHILIQAEDGVAVPVSLVHRTGLVLDGTAPLLLEAYGGYGNVRTPSYNPSLAVWARQGAVYAYAHVRGGGELGGSWRRAALRETKIRTSLDAVAVARGLVQLGYTAPGRISALGTSSGAQMPGMFLALAPELLGAAVFDIGQPDEIRGAALDPTAARNLAEMGDVDTAEGVSLLMQVSPYHRVPERVELPGVIVHSGANDYNFGGLATDAKYVARLQAANSGDRPVVWMTGDGGHDSVFGMDPEVASRAMAFMLWQTGHPDFQPGR